MKEITLSNEIKYSNEANFKSILPESNITLSESRNIFEKKLDDISNRKENIPQKNGEWTGEPGNSKWIPDDNYVSKDLSTNPEQKTMGDLKAEHGFDNIRFRDNEPDFSEIAVGTVKIENFTENRPKNFQQADKKYAEQNDIRPEEVRQHRKEERLTWHERSDCQTMDLVPSAVHGAIPHSGGISKIKQLGLGGTVNV